MNFVGEASNGTDALTMILEKAPDIVLMDIKMPGMTGMDVIETLRNQGVQSLFVMVTAYDDFAFMRQGMQMNVFDYILKPVSDKELYSVLTRAVQSLSMCMEKKKMEQNYKEKSESYEAQLKEANEAVEEKLFVDAINGSKDSARKSGSCMKKEIQDS